MITRELIIQLQEITAPDRVREKEILASHASFRTGGPADLFIQVSDREELQKVMDLLAQAQTDVFLLGRGTNLLIGDGGYRGAVVTMCAPAGTETALSGVRIDGNVIHAGAQAQAHPFSRSPWQPKTQVLPDLNSRQESPDLWAEQS